MFPPEEAAKIVYSSMVIEPLPADPTNLFSFTTQQHSYGQQTGVGNPVLFAFEALGAALAITSGRFVRTWTH